MQIRRADTHDARLLTELVMTVQHIHAENRPDIFKPALVTDDLVKWFENALAQTENHIYIGEVEGKAVGYLFAEVYRRPETPFTHAMEMIYIEQISVNSEHQGKGYGKQLMQAAYDLASAENINRLVLEVWNFNIHAIEFYENRGFQAFNQRMELQL